MRAGTRSPARRFGGGIRPAPTGPRLSGSVGADRAEAERLAATLAATEQGRVDAVRSLTFGAYLTRQWLPSKELHLATSTDRGYERNAKLPVLPALGRIPIRRLRYRQIEALYGTLLHQSDRRGLAPKSVYSLHLIIRGSFDDAVRRGLVSRKVAALGPGTKQRSLQRIEGDGPPGRSGRSGSARVGLWAAVRIGGG
jgi:hypothetical protein